MNKITIHPDAMAYWYFRLNGCLTTRNFVIHPEVGRNQRTDVDIVAVRFPHRSELLSNPMKDDPRLFSDHKRIRVILAEAKTSLCDINGPWKNSNANNMQRALRAIGLFPVDMTDAVAGELYRCGTFKDSRVHISLCCVGKCENQELRKQYPEVPQLTWESVLGFIFNRFNTYRRPKVNHPQWDDEGKQLWDIFDKSTDASDFQQRIVIKI